MRGTKSGETDITDITRQLARFVARTSFASIPEPVRREGVRAFHNWLGCAFGGAREPPVMTALAAIREMEMPAQAMVLGHDLRVDLQNAALLNCMASSLNAFDDTHLASVTHPTGPVAAAILALAERRRVSGADFLLALILGIEVECRLANVLTLPPARGNVGFYMTGLVGGIGAAVAAGKLLGLDEQRMIWALGIAASHASGFREAHATMSLGYVPGHASRTGLFAAQLAAKGFTNSDVALEGAKGFANVFADPPNLAAAIDGLGQRFEVMANAYKPYPCGIVIHPQIDACLEIAGTPGFDATNIERVELTVEPLTLTLCDRPEPQNAMQAVVSLYHWVAAALLYRKAGLDEGVDARVRDPAMIALRRRIKVVADPSLAREEAKATIVFKDGTARSSHVVQCRGSLTRQLTDAELQEKFLAQAVRSIPAAQAARVAELCWKLPALDDVGKQIGAALAP
jgi:2-methylcitrate dehydratase PrpD